MKKYILIYIFISFVSFVNAQTKQNISVKVDGVYGNILKHTSHLNNLVKGPVLGSELAIEWQTMGEKPWHQYFAFPAIGLGVVGLDLGNNEMLGQLLAVYPYLNLRIFNHKTVQLNIKGGAGASVLNKRYNNTPHMLNTLNSPNGDRNQANAAIGSILNVYFAGGGNVELPLSHGFTLEAGLNWNHASNGSFIQPNSGINMINSTLGLKYSPNYKMNLKPVNREIGNLKQKFGVEIIASGGARELYYRDNKMYPIGSVVVNVNRQIGNNVRLGLGLDGFYDGVYNGNTHFGRTYLISDELKNKLRVGLSLQPELVFGKLQAGIHFGLYVYNPLKNLEPSADAKNGLLSKPLIYKYNIDEEDGWFYTRAALKYSITKELFISLGLKTHLQKAEFIEWGIGLRL